ncbi:glycosyltransferase [Acinetobacter thermotolerans]|uniref:glycosyltransferase family 2 protein n=1 Tax=Acinetobacter thermotolerans TaxID=3151487 RepID=UPI00325B6451
MILLSVIVPVYNVQTYIEECLISIFKQIDLNLAELIIVNDGSTDNSLSCIQELIKNYSSQNIILVSQENQGLSSARNAGISISRGRYLAFVDSDDILLDGYFENIFRALNESFPDIVKFNFKTFKEINHLQDNSLFLNKKGVIDVDDQFIIDIFNDSSWYAWAHVYNRLLFEEIRFPVGLNFEDVATIPYIYIKCKTMYFVEKPLYGYRIRSGSITNSSDSRVIAKNVNSLCKILERLLTVSCDDARFFILYVFFLRVYFSYLISFKGVFKSYLEWRRLEKKVSILNISYDKSLFRAKKHVIYYYLYRHFGYLSNFIMIFIVKLWKLYQKVCN